MNANLHRIVFNRSRGQLMVVAESASNSSGGTPSCRRTGTARTTTAALRKLTLATLLALAWPAHAQIVADPTAPTGQPPHVHAASNGVPQVDITRPSAAGVSRNTYSQFDVQQQGAILNNARTNAQTQLGGWVEGNANLSAGSARVILNEVNSANPSQLLGYIEIAGTRAEVVVANPSGITCNGCGFINADRATLTTGLPVIIDGRLDGYRVEGGRILIEGAGMDALSADFASIIARAVEINAGIWAKDITLTAGPGLRAPDGTPGDDLAASDAAPAFAIDVSALGGMYAGKIRLVGTEAGVGVRNAGEIGASAGQLRVTADGRIENLGTLSAASALTLDSTEGIDNRGLINGGPVLLEAETLRNLATGRIYGDRIAIAASSLVNAGEGDSAPVIASRGDLDIGANTIINREEGLIIALGDLSIGGALNDDERATGRAELLHNASATIEALGQLHIAADTVLNTDERFAVEYVQTHAEDFTEYQLANLPARYGADDVSIALDRPNSQQWVLYLTTPDGRGNDWYHYNYTRSTRESRLLDSAPGQLLAGSSLRIDTDTLINDKSRILAAGALDIQADTLLQLDAEGERITADEGTVSHYWRIRRSQGGLSNPQGLSTVRYAPAPDIETFTLSQAELASHADLHDDSAGAGLTLPANALFSPAGDPVGYLIETDPLFTRFEQWLSSDYMLERLGYNPLEVGLRLGDGFYEQQLVREQLARLTGLSNPGGHASHEAQYLALLEAGVTVAQEWGLIPGVALSAEQMAALTTDIVWLVRQSITLPDGNTVEVLAPQVYARVRSGDLDGTGALIAGRDVTLDVAGDMLNQGRILALDSATLHAGNLLNLGGSIFAADTTVLAAGDITMVGGGIGAARSLEVQAGRDLTVAAATYASTGDTGTRSGIARGASLYVSDAQAELFASAGRDVNLVAGNVTNRNGGQTVLVAGRDINLATLLETRQDTVASSQYSLRVQTDTREAGSQLQGSDALLLAAARDLNARGASIAADDITLQAARDVSMTAAQHTANVARDSTDRVSGRVGTWRLEQRAVDGTAVQGGTVTILAGEHQHHAATHISAGGPVTLVAGGDLTLGTATALDSRDAQRGDGRNWRTEHSTFEVGSTIGSDGDITLVAGNDLTARAAHLVSQDGAITAVAGRDLTIEAGQDTHELDAATYKKRSGLLSSRTTVTRTTADQTTHQGTLLSGQSVTASAGRDLTVHGSDIVSTDATTLAAARDLTLEAAVDTAHQHSMRSEKTSGLFSSGGIGVTIGKREIASRAGDTLTYARGSTVGSVEGDVTLLAAQNYRQVGSDVLAPQGNIDIAAERVDIVEARESSLHTQETKTKQSGLTIAITAPVITAVQTAQQMQQASKDTSDSRMKALAGATTALAAMDAYQAVQANPGAAGGVNFTLSIGASKSSSTSTYTADTAAASSVAAGGDVSIRANGAGEQSDITVQGSHISAGRNLTLIAEDDIALLAAANTATQRSDNKSSSARVGISIGSNTGITLGASMERGHAEGDDLSWSNTHLSAGDTLTLRSGDDTTLRGAVVSGERVVAEVGGDLTVESLQDVGSYDAQQKNAGFSITIGVGIPTGGIHYSKSKTDSTYASVTEQSAIRAGDGGFDVRVEGHTELKGGAISSSEAILSGENVLVTATLSASDIQNRASSSADSTGFSLSSDMATQGKYGIAKAVASNALNSGSASAHSSGQTLSTVSDGMTLITDEATQIVLTGQTSQEIIASLHREADSTHRPAAQQNHEALQLEVQAQQAIKMALYRETVKFTDEAYRVTFLQKAEILKVVRNEDGDIVRDEYGNPRTVALTDEEKLALVPGSNGKINVFTNGIFNSGEAAALYSMQMSEIPPGDHVYLVYYPEASNALSELMVAGFQYFLEGGISDLSNAALEIINLAERYGGDGLNLIGHSRGAMTIGNALEVLASSPDTAGMLEQTMVKFLGPAYSAEKAATLLYGLSGGAQTSVQLQNHADDFVGTIIGGNAATYDQRPEGSSRALEWLRILGEAPTVHSCYGTGAVSKSCEPNYGLPVTTDIRANHLK